MITNPPLKYNGSKWLLAKWIISHFPDHTTYLEPFGGGASVLLQKPKSKYEFYNDIDEEVFNFFKVLRENSREFIRAIKYTPYHELEHEQSYDKSESEIENARKFYVKCWHSRGNNYNKNNSFRVVVNNTTGSHIPASAMNRIKNLIEVSKRLKEVHFLKSDYGDLLKRFDKSGILMYLDPPYFADRSNAYNYELIDSESHKILLERIVLLKHAKVILSGYASTMYNDYLQEWTVESKTAFADSKGERTEMLWISPNIEYKRGLFS